MDIIFALSLSLILSGVISPLISSSILGTSRPGEFIFQRPIFLPFHTVHGVLEARILKWFTIPFSSGPHSVRDLLYQYISQLISLELGFIMPCVCGAGFFISSLWKMRTTSLHILRCTVAMGEEQSQGNGFAKG